MSYHAVQIDEFFTSYKFYHSFLPALSSYAKRAEHEPLLFDFTSTKRISSLVIPNLLCVGYIIKSNYDVPATIFVPDNSRSDNIRDFLHDIGFVDLAKQYGLFRFTSSIDYGSGRRIMDPRCQTHEFNLSPEGKDDEGSVRADVHRHFGDFFRTLLSGFERVKRIDDSLANYRSMTNLIEDVCAQLIFNSLDHGQSFAFMTAEVNHAAGRIYISIADCGIGFKKSINRQIACSEEPFENCSRPMADELEAIVNAIFVRGEEEHNLYYGLYPLVRHILGLNGIVRIHSTDTQLILTHEQRTSLDISTGKQNDVHKIRRSFLALMRDEKSNAHNVYTDMKCKGVHVEIELPLVEEGL